MTREKVDAVVQRLMEVATPKKIILFGSYVRDEVTRDSDLDVLVVADDSVASSRKESVRLRDAAAFHAQQAAEKGLKAVLVHAAQSFPKTHDLKKLLLRIDRAGIPETVRDTSHSS